ncbi:MAG TPA: hypothetical protein VFQ54_05195, partial [Thermomicrobiales bacterium]|nr:hypothetical protein [Thermomicrobiales bacterium]
MIEQSSTAEPRRRVSTTRLWLLAMAVLCVWTAWKLGAFDTMTRFTADGRAFDVPNVFSGVDNPFHATRAYTLLQSLKDGHFLRWIGDHQGGYPAEFYPLGVAWLDVGLWALLFGSLPIVAVHKLAIILIFLLPAVGFWVLARCDKVSPGVAVLATAIQVAVPGGNGLTSWATGGYAELVQWGLVTNVAGGTAAMICCAMLVRYVAHGERGMAIGAGLFAAGAAYANPRSLFAIAIGPVAILIVTLISRNGVSPKIIVMRMVL